MLAENNDSSSATSTVAPPDPVGATAAPARDRPAHHGSTRRLNRILFGIGITIVVIVAGAILLGSFSSDEPDFELTHTVSRGDLTVSVIEQGTLESSNNTEIKCKVRGFSTVTWVIEGGTVVEPGQKLVTLDTKVIEENLSLTKTNEHIATATLERTKADVATAKIAIDAYLKGRYRTQQKSMEKELERAKSQLLTAEEVLKQTELLYSRGYVNDLELEENAYAVKQAKLELKVKQTELDVLERFTKEMELETMKGNLKATKSKLDADLAGLKMDTTRRIRAEEELDNCTIKADRAGLVIYPSAAAWKNTPDITEGAAVRHDQVLLLMPDLTQMQVKVGIHESIVDRVKKGQIANVTLPDRDLEAKVTSVATVTKPAGWWTGNVVKYDTIIELPSEEGLKPGMSAEIEIILAEHKDVLTIPVAAVVETDEGSFCWVTSSEGEVRRTLTLGDSNDIFIIVEAGLKEGDQVILNPLAAIEEAQEQALKSEDSSTETNTSKPESERTENGEANE